MKAELSIKKGLKELERLGEELEKQGNEVEELLQDIREKCSKWELMDEMDK